MRLRLSVVFAVMAGVCFSNLAHAGEFFPSTGRQVPNQYIVILDHDPGERLETLPPEIGAVLIRERIPVVSVWNVALDGLVVSDTSESTARELSSLPGVAYVEPDVFGLSESVQNNPPYGLDWIDQRVASPLSGTYTYLYTAANVHAYVIDSGIRTTHVDFGGRAQSDVDFTNDGLTGDPYHHGTEVASVIGGTIHGVAKQVHLHSVRVTDGLGHVTASQVISGLNWVAQHSIHPAVANISINFAPTSSLDLAVAGAVGTGVFVAVSAGNGGTVAGPADACGNSPAREPSALTVGGVAYFSATGSCVDVFGPASSVPVAAANTDTGSTTATGTSFSSPHAAGVAVLVYSQFPTLTPNQVAWEVIARSTKNSLASMMNLYGSPDRFLYALALGQTSVPSVPISLHKDPCVLSTDIIDWVGGATNNTNSATYYELQRSAYAAYSPLASTTFADGTLPTGHATLSGSLLFIRVRACNSLGCSAFKEISNLVCNPNP